MRRFATIKLLNSFLFYGWEKACSMKSCDCLTGILQIVLKLRSMTLNSSDLIFPYVHVIVSFFVVGKIGSSVVKLHVYIWSTVSPFVITDILHKWILTTFQDEQKTLIVCVCVCVLTKIVSVLTIYTRCILRLIRYSITILLCTIFCILCWRFYTIFYAGPFVPYDNFIVCLKISLWH